MLSPVFVAIGANLPGPDGEPALVTCERAVAALRELPGMRLVAVSRWFRTAPVPVSDQPDYINGAVWLAGTMTPEALLAALQQIETAQGRVRGARNAARTLDLDIVAMGDLARDAPDPVLPHPRMAARAFVLRPLADIAPEWRHPASGLSVREMLAQLGPEADAPEPL